MRLLPALRPRRLLRAGLGVAVVVAALGLPASRASANTETGIKLSVGQSVTKSYSDLVGDDGEGDAYNQGAGEGAGNPNYNNDNAQDPSDCDPLPSCDDIPVVLNVPKTELTTNNNYLLEISFTYQGGPGANTPLGTQTVNTVAGSLWDNPVPTTGPHANSQDGSCFVDPCVVNEASPDTNSFSFVADQITGYADAFTVTFKLVDVGSGGSGCVETASGPICKSSETPAGGSSGGPPSGQSATPTTQAPGAGALPPLPSGGSLPSASTIGLVLPSFQVQSGGPNPILSALSSVQIGSVLGIGGRSLRQGTSLGIPGAEPASSLAVALALATTPILVIAGYVALIRRRRQVGI